MDKQEQDCWNCERVVKVVQSKSPCPYRPSSKMPVYCNNWIERKQSEVSSVKE